MDPPTAPTPRPKRFRLTTGTLMIWVFAAAVAMGLLRGDLVHWLSPTVVLVFPLTLLALVVGIPWLAHLAERSRNPAVRRPWTERERRFEQAITLALLGLLTASLLIFAMLAYSALVPGP
jgi:hypothetical protein